MRQASDHSNFVPIVTFYMNSQEISPKENTVILLKLGDTDKNSVMLTHMKFSRWMIREDEAWNSLEISTEGPLSLAKY